MRKIKAEALKTREYLMQSALDTFYQKGISHSSLNEIAQNAGVTRGALYWHFKNKEDLFDALFHHIFDNLSQSLENDINESTNIWASLRSTLLKAFDLIENNEAQKKLCCIIHFKCEHTEQNQAIVNLMRNYQNLWFSLISETLRACLKQQALKENLNIDLAATYIQALIDGLIYKWQYSDNMKLSQTGEILIDIALQNIKENPLMYHK